MQDREKEVRNEVGEMLQAGASSSEIEALLDRVEPAVLLHTMFGLEEKTQRALLAALTPHRAASLVEELPDSHAATLIEDMAVTEAAPIVEELASDHRVDVLPNSTAKTPTQLSRSSMRKTRSKSAN